MNRPRQIDLEPGKGFRRRQSRAEPGQPVFLPGGAARLLIALAVYVGIVAFTFAAAPVYAYLYEGPYMGLVCGLFGC